MRLAVPRVLTFRLWVISVCLWMAMQSAGTAGAQQTHTTKLSAEPQAIVPPAFPRDYVPATVEDARALLRAREAERPVNQIEVAKSLAAIALLESAYEKVTEETIKVAQHAVSLSKQEAGEDSLLYAYTLAVEGRVYAAMDRPDLGRPLVNQAVTIARRGDERGGKYANIVAALSYVCYVQDDRECALHAAELQVESARSEREQRPTYLASALNTLAVYRSQNHDQAGAEKAVDEALALEADQKDLSDPMWVSTESAAGMFYLSAHKFEKALEHLKKAINLSVRQKGPDDLDQATMIGHLAVAEMSLGQTVEAFRDYAKAHDMYVRRFGPAHSLTADLDYKYSEALHFMGHDNDAIQWALRAHRMKREYISLAIRLMPERQALALAAVGMPSLGAAVTMAVEHPELATADVYQEVVRSRALVAEEMAMRAAGLNKKHDAGVELLEKELETDRRSVMNLEGSGKASSAALTDATAKMEKAELELAQRSLRFRADERARSSALADLHAGLPARTVLISYVKYDRIPTPPRAFADAPIPSYAAFIMHPDGRPISVHPLGEAARIESLVERMRASADDEAHGGGIGSGHNEREYRAAGEQLRKIIWDPLAAEMEGASRVFVVPDGVLNLIPFGSLPSGAGYLVERGPLVHFLSSERDLLPNNSEEKKTGLLAIGGPSFEVAQAEAPPAKLRGGSVQCDAVNKLQFQPLPGSLHEVTEICADWKRWNPWEPDQLLTGEGATRWRFLRSAQESRVLHIATHAFVLDQSCGNGNPLLHSGLVFAGANTSPTAGILTAQQIASLDLNGVDWAVLSACNTGNGPLRDGEGVMGLQRSFRVAGARSVIMALWPVDDTVTREFMHTLYMEHYGRHASTAESVWRSARILLRTRRSEGKSTHPWYWAGFVGAGAWQ